MMDLPWSPDSRAHALSVTNDDFSAVCLEASAQPSHKTKYTHIFLSTKVQESVEAVEEAYPWSAAGIFTRKTVRDTTMGGNPCSSTYLNTALMWSHSWGVMLVILGISVPRASWAVILGISAIQQQHIWLVLTSGSCWYVYDFAAAASEAISQVHVMKHLVQYEFSPAPHKPHVRNASVSWSATLTLCLVLCKRFLLVHPHSGHVAGGFFGTIVTFSSWVTFTLHETESHCSKVHSSSSGFVAAAVSYPAPLLCMKPSGSASCLIFFKDVFFNPLLRSFLVESSNPPVAPSSIFFCDISLLKCRAELDFELLHTQAHTHAEISLSLSEE